MYMIIKKVKKKKPVEKMQRNRLPRYCKPTGPPSPQKKEREREKR
jgi:hypothetical protein